MEFRPVYQEELERVFQLYRSAVGRKFSVWNESYPGWEEIQEDHNTGNLFVLAQGSHILGALSIVPRNELDALPCWRLRENAAEIARVVVSPSHQGNGLALYMVQTVIPILKQRGYRAVHLSAAKANLPALKTYQNAGFTTVGEAYLFGHDYYLMEIEIGKETSESKDSCTGISEKGDYKHYESK